MERLPPIQYINLKYLNADISDSGKNWMYFEMGLRDFAVARALDLSLYTGTHGVGYHHHHCRHRNRCQDHYSFDHYIIFSSLSQPPQSWTSATSHQIVYRRMQITYYPSFNYLSII